MAARKLVQWKKEEYIGFAPAIIASLCFAWGKESKPQVKDAIDAILSRLLMAFPLGGTLYHPREEIILKDIQSGLRNPSPSDEELRKLTKKLDDWIAEAQPAH